MRLVARKEPRIAKEDLLFTNKKIFQIILPLLLSQVLGVMVSTIDTAMVSYAGEDAVSGVSLVGSMDALLVIFFTAMISGGGVVLSQTLGRKNYTDVYEVAKQLVYIALLLAVILTVLTVFFGNSLLTLLYGEASESIMNNARNYFRIVRLSFPLLAIVEGIGACFRVSGNTKVSLYVSIIINLTNVCFNSLFIYVLGMGVEGAALATVIARIVGSIIMVILILNKKYEIHIERPFSYRPNLLIIKKIMSIGIPNGIESSMFQFGRLLTQSLISTLGSTAIAANAIGLNVSNFQYLTGNAFSSTMLTVVGFCIGSRELKQAKYYSRRLLGLHYLTLWTVIAGTLIFLDPIISIYNLSSESAEIAKQLITYHAICGAAIWPLGFMLPSSLRAAGDVRFTMVVSMITMWTFRVVGAYVCALETVSVFGIFSFSGLGWGISGVWFAMTVDWVFRATLYVIRYLRGDWLKRKSVAVGENPAS